MHCYRIHVKLNLSKLSHASAVEGDGIAWRYKQHGDLHKSASHMKDESGTDLNITAACGNERPNHFYCICIYSSVTSLGIYIYIVFMNPILRESANFAWSYVIFFYAYYEITCTSLFKCVI
jgi:hypothetical protein